MEERHIVCPYCGCINEINELIGRRYVCKNCGGVLRGYPQNNIYKYEKQSNVGKYLVAILVIICILGIICLAIMGLSAGQFASAPTSPNITTNNINIIPTGDNQQLININNSLQQILEQLRILINNI
jgi:hypothetical protein